MNRKFTSIESFNMCSKRFYEKIDDLEMKYSHELNNLRIDGKMTTLSNVVVINKTQIEDYYIADIQYKTTIRNPEVKKLVVELFCTHFEN